MSHNIGMAHQYRMPDFLSPSELPAPMIQKKRRKTTKASKAVKAPKVSPPSNKFIETIILQNPFDDSPPSMRVNLMAVGPRTNSYMAAMPPYAGIYNGQVSPNMDHMVRMGQPRFGDPGHYQQMRPICDPNIAAHNRMAEQMRFEKMKAEHVRNEHMREEQMREQLIGESLDIEQIREEQSRNIKQMRGQQLRNELQRAEHQRNDQIRAEHRRTDQTRAEQFWNNQMRGEELMTNDQMRGDQRRAENLRNGQGHIRDQLNGNEHMEREHMKRNNQMRAEQMIYPPHQPIIFDRQNPNAPPIYPCRVCQKEVDENDQGILCESGCNFWFHRHCNGLTEQAFHFLKAEVFAEWCCDECLSTKDIPLVKFKS